MSKVTAEEYERITRSLKRVRAPLLVVWGDQDPSPLPSQETWATAVPRPRRRASSTSPTTPGRSGWASQVSR